MDIVKTQEKTSLFRRYWYLPLGAMLLIAFFIGSSKYRNVTYLADEGSLLMDEVVAGDLSVSVRGYGQLASSDVYWIGAETEGRVARVLVRPGDVVHKGDVIVELLNPQLLQQLKDAELEFEARKAEVRANQIGRESELLDLRTQATTAEIDHQTAKMDLDAKTKLIEQGLDIISRLDYQSSQLNVQKIKQHWDMQLLRVNKSEESLLATNDADEARLLQTENELEKFRIQVRNLSVTANVAGIVQEMELELGQQIDRGTNITRIARPDKLVAEVQIQELQVNDIQIGMSAFIDTRTSEIDGRVSRIDPAVVDGSVLVEIELLGALPVEVRPDLNIEANISVAHVVDTVYVRRPVFARPESASFVYKLNADGDIADRVSVRYGAASTNYIEVLEGLRINDRIIISDPSAYNSHERILLR